MLLGNHPLPSIIKGENKIKNQGVLFASQTKSAQSKAFVREINGITFIDAHALERAIPRDVPPHCRLRQKLILAGATFWDTERTIIKRPVLGLCSIGGFSVCLGEELAPNQIYLYLGTKRLGPLTLDDIAEALQNTMGMQAFHTYQNPNAKTAQELFYTAMKHGHHSITHAAHLGFYLLGISKKAELEFAGQRDLVYMARTAAQNEPCLVALSEEGAFFAQQIRKYTKNKLRFFNTSNTIESLEERNALYPLSAAVSMGLDGTVKNINTLISSGINNSGRELEYREILKLMAPIVYNLVPELKRDLHPISCSVDRTEVSEKADNLKFGS